MAFEFTDTNFQEAALDSDVSVVDFWAEWCGPCRLVGPIIDDLATEYEGKAVIGKLNVDTNPEIATKYMVRSIPTVLVFKNGELVDKQVGAATKATYEAKIKAALN